MSSLPPINVEFVWMAKAPHVEAPLEALMHILAGAISQQFDEPTAIFVHGRTPEMLVWRNNTLEAADNQPIASTFDSRETVTAAIASEIVPNASKKHYALFVYPDDPNRRPPRYQHLKFHRIVYVTDGPPSVIPDGLGDLLHEDFAGTHPSVDNSSNPPFSAFIPTIRIEDRARFGDYAVSVAANCLTYGTSVQDFRTRVINDDLQQASMTPASTVEYKLHRDLCRVRLDFLAIEQQWNTWLADSWTGTGGAAQATPFIDTLVPPQKDYESSASRWAAAVTNRRTGVALSGGGACAYRFGPLLRRLREQKVPIHVLGGVSGGALIGAYCAVDPENGFNLMAQQGPLFWFAMPLSLYSTLPLEAKVNWDLDGARVEEMETRFVAVTTRLPESTPPQATAVVRGTVGEGVRASGTLPPPYAPTRKNGVRYTDGAASAIIPADVLRDFGADVVLAMNCIPGPDRTNPYDRLPLGSFFYNYTPFGRSVDGWAWNAFQMQRTSRRFGRQADVFVEYEPVTVPFQECIEFLWPRVIVRRAEQGSNARMLQDAARKFKECWEQLGTP